MSGWPSGFRNRNLSSLKGASAALMLTGTLRRQLECCVWWLYSAKKKKKASKHRVSLVCECFMYLGVLDPFFFLVSSESPLSFPFLHPPPPPTPKTIPLTSIGCKDTAKSYLWFEWISFFPLSSGGGTGGPCPSPDSWSKVQGENYRRMDDCASPRMYSAMAEWPLSNRTGVLFGGVQEDRSLIKVR